MGIFRRAAKLTDLQTGKEYRLGSRIRMGTSPDCDIVVPAEYAGIAAFHSEIIPHEHLYIISKGNDPRAAIYIRRKGSVWVGMERRVPGFHVDVDADIQIGGSMPQSEADEPRSEEQPGYMLKLEF